MLLFFSAQAVAQGSVAAAAGQPKRKHASVVDDDNDDDGDVMPHKESKVDRGGLTSNVIQQNPELQRLLAERKEIKAASRLAAQELLLLFHSGLAPDVDSSVPVVYLSLIQEQRILHLIDAHPWSLNDAIRWCSTTQILDEKRGYPCLPMASKQALPLMVKMEQRMGLIHLCALVQGVNRLAALEEEHVCDDVKSMLDRWLRKAHSLAQETNISQDKHWTVVTSWPNRRVPILAVRSSSYDPARWINVHTVNRIIDITVMRKLCGNVASISRDIVIQSLNEECTYLDGLEEVWSTFPYSGVLTALQVIAELFQSVRTENEWRPHRLWTQRLLAAHVTPQPVHLEALIDVCEQALHAPVLSRMLLLELHRCIIRVAPASVIRALACMQHVALSVVE